MVGFLRSLLGLGLTCSEPMQGMSEDEGDDEEPEVQVDAVKIEAAKKARDERAEKLRKMMEDDGKLKVGGSCACLS